MNKTWAGELFSSSDGLQLFWPESAKYVDADVTFSGSIDNKTISGEVIKTILQAELGAGSVPVDYMDYITAFEYQSPSRVVRQDAVNKTFAALEIADNFTMRAPATVRLSVLPNLI